MTVAVSIFLLAVAVLFLWAHYLLTVGKPQEQRPAQLQVGRLMSSEAIVCLCVVFILLLAALVVFLGCHLCAILLLLSFLGMSSMNRVSCVVASFFNRFPFSRICDILLTFYHPPVFFPCDGFNEYYALHRISWPILEHFCPRLEYGLYTIHLRLSSLAMASMNSMFCVVPLSWPFLFAGGCPF